MRVLAAAAAAARGSPAALGLPRQSAAQATICVPCREYRFHPYDIPDAKSAFELLFHLDDVDKRVFVGYTPWFPFPSVSMFGGQPVAQALMAAGRTLEGEHKDKIASSVHAHFIRPGDMKNSSTYQVEVIRDGRNFSTRRVEASQDGVVFCTCMMSFQHHVDSAMTHQTDMPEGVPPPEDLVCHDDAIERLLKSVPPAEAEKMRKFPPPQLEMRNAGDLKTRDQTEVAKQFGVGYASEWWIQLRQALSSDSPLLHQCALAYMSDLTLVHTTLLHHNKPWLPGVTSASLDHSIWFQARPRISDWLLYATESPASGGGRGLNMGRMYASDGTLLLCSAQEGAYRFH